MLVLEHGALWSPAYLAALAGGAPLAIIKQYVEQHRQRASSSR
jgi:putative transposase